MLMDQYPAKQIELINAHSKQEAIFFRHLLMVASGCLAVLAALSAQTPPDNLLARYFLMGTWALLGLSVLSGIGATYLSVHLAKKLKFAFPSQLETYLRNGDYQQPMPAVSAKPHWFFVLCSYVFVSSWLLAVISLVAYSIINLL